MDNIISQLTGFKRQIDELMTRIDIAGKVQLIEALEGEASESDFWNNPDAAQKTMQRLSKLKSAVDRWGTLADRIADAIELAEIADADMQAELEAETEALGEIVETMSLQAMLAGDYDNEDAIFAIHAGAGGVDAQDWAEMLERMYLRWMEQNGYKAEILDRSNGDEAGIKSVTVSVKGDYAYGYLQSEEGVHRLVRLSPFDSASRRHTSFAKVELWPDIQSDIEIEIEDRDIRVDTYRASGAGGQHVQKNDTAVRITHLPTEHGRAMPEPAQPGAKPRPRHANSQGSPLRNGTRPTRSGNGRTERRERRRRLGQSDPFLRAAPLPDGQRPPHQR